MKSAEVFPVDPRTDPERERWVREFESPGTRRAVFGCNNWGSGVAAVLDVEYFIDDVVDTTTFASRPVIRSAQADRTVKTLSTVVGGRPLTARQRLTAVADSHLDYFSYLKFARCSVRALPYLADTTDELANFTDRYHELRQCLFDEESRDTLDRVLRLRRSLDLEAMVVFTDRQRDQYFEPFIRLDGNSVFLDVGAFDGYTSRYARARYGDNIFCHLFEPSPSAADSLAKTFENSSRTSVHLFALGDADGTVGFTLDGSSSRAGSGDATVSVRRLDGLNIGRVDLIKADVEGFEEAVLEGGAETIRREQPQLAIACYHSTGQIRRVFEIGRRLLPDARIYLRHYTEGFAETDMFFIPPRFW